MQCCVDLLLLIPVNVSCVSGVPTVAAVGIKA